MSENNWYHVDNVAKVFLADHNPRNTRSIRVSCILKEPIEEDILLQAVEETLRIRPQFQVRIRRGLFWHYMEETDAKPVVGKETDRPCPVLYGKSYKGIVHYQITYYGKRINVDLFHGVTDGTGALEYLNILVYNYLNIKYPNTLDDIIVQSGADAEALQRDSFKQFYEKAGLKVPNGTMKRKAYHIRSRKLSYNQLQFMEVHMPFSQLKEEYKKYNVTMTSYLGARLMMAIYKDMPAASRKMPVTISMPVNLRNFFPSDTNRNFFNSVRVSHIFTGEETLEILATEFDQKLKNCLSVDRIKKQMEEFSKLENLIFTRVVPLFVKQPVVRYFAKQEAKQVTAVLSNLGGLKLPKEMEEHVDYYSAFCATDELFMTVSSFQDKVVFGVSSAYVSNSVIKNLVRDLQKEGIEIKVAATEVIR